MHAQRHLSPLFYLLGVIAILTVVRWVGLGDAHTLTIVNLGLLTILVIWGSLISRRRHRATRDGS
jgi:hypothetical protein